MLDQLIKFVIFWEVVQRKNYFQEYSTWMISTNVMIKFSILTTKMAKYFIRSFLSGLNIDSNVLYNIFYASLHRKYFQFSTFISWNLGWKKNCQIAEGMYCWEKEAPVGALVHLRFLMFNSMITSGKFNSFLWIVNWNRFV